MPELPFPVPGEPIDSGTFGSPVVERVVSRYADDTERDSQSPSPSAGEVAYIAATSEVQIFDGVSWTALARVNFESLLVYGDSQGYWLRPDPNDNTKDFRIVATTNGEVLVQSRETGSFVTVAGFASSNAALPYRLVLGNERPNSGSNIVTDPVQTLVTKNFIAGRWKVTQLGWLECSTNLDGNWVLQAITVPGGTVMVKAEASHRGSVVGTNFRANLAATSVFDLSTGTDVALQVIRPGAGGTQIIRQWQLIGEWLGPQ